MDRLIFAARKMFLLSELIPYTAELSGSRDFLAPAPLRLPGFQNAWYVYVTMSLLRHDFSEIFKIVI